MWLDSIELDDDHSDAESTDSTPDAFSDIPLPSLSTPPPVGGSRTQSAILDSIPLPESPVHEKPSSAETLLGSGTKPVKTPGDEPPGVRDAVLAKTSVGTITVLLNRKLGPRVSRASVFDPPDDNIKEVNRKLVKLRRLKRLKRNHDGTAEPESSGLPAAGRKALQQRISEWKEELLKDQKSRRQRGGSFDVVTGPALAADTKDMPTAEDDRSLEVRDRLYVSAVSSGLKSDADVKSESGLKSGAIVDSVSTPTAISDDQYMLKLYNSFTKVASSDDRTQLDWPREMVRETLLAPKLVYSCNPLYFSFRKLQSAAAAVPQGEDGMSKKHKHAKKRKKNSAAGKADGGKAKAEEPAGAKTELADKQNLNPKASSHRKSKGGKVEVEKSGSHCKKKKKSVTGADERNSAARPEKPDSSVADGEPPRNLVSCEANSQAMHLTDVDDVLLHLSGTLKSTGRSRWDTSSDSEPETASPLDPGTCYVQVPPSPGHTRAAPRKNRSLSKSARSSRSASSGRSRKRYRSVSRSSASSYSRSTSSYRSSSASYRRHRRRRRLSTRSYSSYSDTDYSRSSRSYSRSRSASHHRRWRSRSNSRSWSSSSASRSPSPRRRQSPRAQKPPRTAVLSRRPCAEPAEVKPSTQTQKSAAKGKVKTDIVGPNPDEVKPTAAEPTKAEPISSESAELDPVDGPDSKPTPPDASIDLKSIPTPEEHMQSIPLPVPASSKPSFIGPVLPSDHPLAHKQEIPLPRTAKFQQIGPNDPLVFRRMAPPPLPPASLTTHSRSDSSIDLLPRPPSPPAEDMDEDIAGDEDPIPQMLDVNSLRPASFIPPEQDEMYGALRRQAELHARRQQIREETGMDIADDEEEEGLDPVSEDPLGEPSSAYLEETSAVMSATPVIGLAPQQIVGHPLVSVQMLPRSSVVGLDGMVGIEPSLVSLVHQGQTPTVLAVSPAAAALARAQEEAKAEAQLALAMAQRQRAAAELLQLVPRHATPSFALQPTRVPVQAVPVLASAQPQQHHLIQLSAGKIIGVPNVIPGGVQVIAQPHPQPAPLVIGPNGTILRLIR